MRFPRNIFYPIRLILYPTLLITMAGISGWIVSETLWIILNLISTLLLGEAIWEFIHPYAELNETELVINTSILSKRKIDLTKYTADDIKYHDWHLQIGNEFISLRRIRAGYRDRFEEAIELYFSSAQYQSA